MSNKRSSFQMGNQFNGCGEAVYLKADPVKVPPVSQDNVQITPDYSSFALKAIEGSPSQLNSNPVDESINAMLGSQTAVNHVALAKNMEDGNYVASFKVAPSRGFLADSYPTNQISTKKAVTGKLDYFAITTTSNLTIREGRSLSANGIGTIKCGARFQVITENGHIVELDDDDDSNKPKWTKATNGTVTGWVSSEFIRPDKKDTIKLSKYKLDKSVEIKVTFKDGSVKTKKETPSMKWCMIGEGSDYPTNCQKKDGKWIVAVGPAILDRLYSENGKCFDTDIKPFSKLIKVTLRPKTSTGKEITEEFFVSDIKAHTFNEYKYPKTIKKTKEDNHYISDGVRDVTITPKIDPGMIQTGIRYPNASNGTVVALIKDKNKKGAYTVDNIDYSLIEFCGGNVPDFKNKFQKYELISIEINYEESTRGKLYDYYGKEKKENK